MEAEITRLKQDFKKDKKFRTDLKRMNSKEWSVAETIHQRTEWLRSVGYQIDETEYTNMFLSDLHRSLWWRMVLLGMCFGVMGTMFARHGISWIMAAGSSVCVLALSQSLINMYHFLTFLGKIYKEEMSLKIRHRALPAVMITAIVGGFIFGMISTNAILIVSQYTETRNISDKNWVYHFNEDKTVTLTKYLGESEKVNLPEKYMNRMVTCIGESAFADCDSLKGVKIPESVTEIGERAFFNCTGLKNIEIPNSVTEIGERAFFNCTGLKSIVLSKSLTEIKDSTFGASTFLESNKLESIEIPESVTAIGSSAFCNSICLTSIEIPGSVTSIGSGAFSNCSQLKELMVSPENDKYETIDDVLFEKNSKLLICYPAGLEAEEYIIPDGVETIGDQAFYLCWKLKSVRMPDSVKTIGYEAFCFCSDLENIDIPQGVVSIGGRAFRSCKNLTDIVLPNSIEVIDEFAFTDCTGLTSIKIPDSVTEIKPSVFSGCSSLTSIEIPDSVAAIRQYAFQDCTSLTSVQVPDSVVEIDRPAFNNCKKLSLVVEKDSFAEQYARDTGIPFMYGD